MNDDFPPWNWEIYNPKEEDEELDFYKELCPLIANNVEYWCKYELDFEPWKFDKKRREKILKYMKKNKIDTNIYYPLYGFGQFDGIKAMVNPDIREVVIVAGRRSGKTMSYFAATTFLAWNNFSFFNPPRSPMGVIVCSHRREHAVDVIMSEIKSRLNYTKNIKNYITNDSKMSIEFGPINTTIYSIPTSRYEQVKGYTNPLKIFMDETVLIKDNRVFSAIRPLLNQRGVVTLEDGTKKEYNIGMVLTSTPEGMNNYFASRFFLAQEKDSMFSLRWHSLDSPYVNYKGVIDELLEPNCDLLMWRQEYGAEFLYVANSFYTPEWVDKSINFDLRPFGELTPSYRPLYWGIDWGAVRDSTVIWVWEDMGNRLRFKFAEEIRNTEYDEQVDRIVYLSTIIKPTIIKADLAGRAQNTILANKYGLPLSPVEGVSMNLQGKHHLYMHAKTMLQAGYLECPPNPKWREQMIGISATKSMNGVYLSFSKEHVGFDDWVDAFVLATSCKELIGGVYKPQSYTSKTSIKDIGRKDFSSYRPVSRTITSRSRRRKTWAEKKEEMEKERKKVD